MLLLGKWLRPLLEHTLPSGRLIDQVKVKPDSPQEDAFGIANMQTTSFAHGLYFTKDLYKPFNKGVFLDGMSEEEVNIWPWFFTDDSHFQKVKGCCRNLNRTLLIKEGFVNK